MQLENNQYMITGKVKGLEGPCPMYVTEETAERGFRIDSIKVDFNWIYIFNGEGEEDFVSTYNVIAYPTMVNIDPDGMIVDRYEGEREEFYEKLEKLLGN